jgi:hypothetical protein
MVRRLLCGAVVALSCGSAVAVAARPRLEIQAGTELAIAMDCSADSGAVKIARKEAARVWAGAGVGLQWVTASDLPLRSSRTHWLVVRCVSGASTTARAAGALPIAAIRFVDSQPMNTIVVHLGNADALLKDDRPESRDLDRRFGALKNRRLGLMLGRAIAHEIGHFLSQSGAHAESGLMRASHSVTALTGESDHPFKVLW